MLTRQRRSTGPTQVPDRPSFSLAPFTRSRAPRVLDAASPLGGSRQRATSVENPACRNRPGGEEGEGIRRPVNLDQLEFGDERRRAEGPTRRRVSVGTVWSIDLDLVCETFQYQRGIVNYTERERGGGRDGTEGERMSRARKKEEEDDRWRRKPNSSRHVLLTLMGT